MFIIYLPAKVHVHNFNGLAVRPTIVKMKGNLKFVHTKYIVIFFLYFAKERRINKTGYFWKMDLIKTHVRILNKVTLVRFQVLTAASMMFRIVFWDVLPCKMIVDQRFRGAYCLHHQGSSSSLDRRFRGAYCLHHQGSSSSSLDRRFRGAYCLHHQGSSLSSLDRRFRGADSHQPKGS
jgi:hypothetical protein